MTDGTEPQAMLDTAALRADLKTVSALAGDNGKLLIASFGENITTGVELRPKFYCFRPCNYASAAEKFIELTNEPHRNVYMSFALLRHDLPEGKKGSEADVVAVIGIVADFDAKNDKEAENWRARLPMQPTMVLETSSIPAPSFQCRFIFKEPIEPARAKKLAVALAQHSGCDPVTKDVSHVWRCAGGLNKPNRKKMLEGRPPHPQLVQTIVPYSEGRLINPDDLEKLLTTLAEEQSAVNIDPPKIDARFDNIIKKHWPLNERQLSLLKELAGIKWEDIDKQLTPEDCNLDQPLTLQAKFCVNAPKDLVKDENGNYIRPTNKELGYSYSEPLVAFAGAALRNSVNIRDICGVLSNPDLLISNHIYKNASAEDRAVAVVRAIATAICTQRDLGCTLVCIPGVEMFSEDHLAEVFAKNHTAYFAYCHEWGWWIEWDGTRWRRENTLLVFDKIRRICREAAQYAGRTALKIASAATMSSVERISRSDRRLARESKIFDKNEHLLNTPDGIVDLTTGKLQKHDPEMHCTKITHVGPAPEGAMPTLWLRFLGEITGNDAEFVAYLQRMCGYMLTGDIAEHALFFAWGTGSNGKSVFLNTLRYIMGDYGTSTPVDTITASPHPQHPTDLADLRGARLVTVQETEEGRRWAESKVKMMTGGDEIKARFMRQDFFTYTPQFKLLIAGNHRPGLSNVDEAMRRRIHLLPFTITVPEKKRDKQLEQKLRDEAPAILRWMLDGCRAWQELGGLNPPEKVRIATTDYLQSEDTLGQWLAECTQREPAKHTSVKDAFDSFLAFCKESNEVAKSKKAFSQQLEDRGYELKKSNGIRVVWGLMLNAGEAEKIIAYRMKYSIATCIRTDADDDPLPFS